jgi:phosphoglycerate dehydrogenase-like enzyme
MSSPRVVVLNRAAHGVPATEYAAALRERLPDAEVVYAATRDEALAELPGTPIVTGLTFDAELLAAADALELFAAGSAGVGHLPLDAFAERGVAVTNASGVHGPAVAEHVCGWLLVLARRLDEGLRRSDAGEWRHLRAHGELADATVTVVGLGAIGTALLERLAPFGPELIGVRHSPAKGGPADEVVGYDGFGAVLPRTDYLALTCPLTETTAGLVDAEALTALPPDAALVNVARGGVVETDALVDALRGERLRAAALDVTDPEPLPGDHPLWSLSNCHVTAHVAGHTPRYWERLADLVAGNVERVAAAGGVAAAELANRI